MGAGASKTGGALSEEQTRSNQIFPGIPPYVGERDEEEYFERIVHPGGVLEQTDLKNLLKSSSKDKSFKEAGGGGSSGGQVMERGQLNGDDSSKRVRRGFTRKLDAKAMKEVNASTITDFIDERTRTKLHNRFSLLDKDNTGRLGVDMMSRLLALVGENPVQSRLKELIEEMFPNDEKESLTFLEFLWLWYKHKEELNVSDLEIMLKDAFQFLDKDESGSLSFDEFKEVLTEVGDGLTDDECLLFFKSVDTSGNWQLEYDEFLEFFMKDLENARRMYSHTQQDGGGTAPGLPGAGGALGGGGEGGGAAGEDGGTHDADDPPRAPTR